MIVKGNDPVDGRNNKRINDCKPTNCECTAAWSNSDELYDVELVNKPSIDRVIDAKDWVDNGSKL